MTVFIQTHVYCSKSLNLLHFTLWDTCHVLRKTLAPRPPVVESRIKNTGRLMEFNFCHYKDVRLGPLWERAGQQSINQLEMNYSCRAVIVSPKGLKTDLCKTMEYRTCCYSYKSKECVHIYEV